MISNRHSSLAQPRWRKTIWAILLGVAGYYAAFGLTHVWAGGETPGPGPGADPAVVAPDAVQPAPANATSRPPATGAQPGSSTQAAAAPLASPSTTAPAPKRDLIKELLGNQIIVLFAIVALGLILGNIELKGISLGGSGVLFVALIFGHYQCKIPGVVGTLGLVLFVYGVGVGAGPRFFRAFVTQGKALAKMGILLVGAGAATTYLCAKLMHVPYDLSVGIFAGSLTSTPALAAALDALGPEGKVCSIGYGVAYPFGVIGVVLFVQLLPRLLRVDVDALGQEIAAARGARKMILRAVVEVTNPAVFGRPLVDLHFVQRSGCQIVRVMQDRVMVPVSPQLVLAPGQRLLVVGTEEDLALVVDFLGTRSNEPFHMDAERERKQVVVTAQAVVGRSLRGLDVLRAYGVTVSRIVRNDVNFVPNADTIIEQFDVLTAVGEPANLEKFAGICGHRTKAIDETDLASLSLGITLGVIIGMMPLGFGEGHSLSLGMAGGPLLVALLLGHFGHIGAISGYTPRAARYLMTELGLALFLAGAGISAGASFLEVIHEHGVKLFLMGAIVTTVPMIVGYFVATKILRLNFLEMLGGTCGGMTSTPGLGAVTAKTDSDIPVTSYATAYPVALIFMTIAAQLLLSLLR